MNNEKDCLDYLKSFDSQLNRAGADEVKKVEIAQAETAEHEAVLDHFNATNEGLLDGIRAKAALDSLDAMLFPSGQRPTAALARSARTEYFQHYAAQRATAAREKLVHDHAVELAAAIENLISLRSRNRSQWRGGIADRILAIERQLLLDEVPEEKARQLRFDSDQFSGQLFAADDAFREANRFAKLLRSKPNLETLETARQLALSLSFSL